MAHLNLSARVIETAVDGGRLLSLQWRPRDAANLNDGDLAVRLVSADGALDGEAMQRVLVDADGLVFLLDSEPDAGERNQRALETVRGAISRASNKRVPVVVQVNQREGASGQQSLETIVAARERVGLENAMARLARRLTLVDRHRPRSSRSRALPDPISRAQKARVAKAKPHGDHLLRAGAHPGRSRRVARFRRRATRRASVCRSPSTRRRA